MSKDCHHLRPSRPRQRGRERQVVAPGRARGRSRGRGAVAHRFRDAHLFQSTRVAAAFRRGRCHELPDAFGHIESVVTSLQHLHEQLFAALTTDLVHVLKVEGAKAPTGTDEDHTTLASWKAPCLESSLMSMEDHGMGGLTTSEQSALHMERAKATSTYREGLDNYVRFLAEGGNECNTSRQRPKCSAQMSCVPWASSDTPATRK